MKRSMLFLLMLCSFPSIGQKMDSDYFEEGLQFYQTEKFEESVARFKYIVDNYPKSSYLAISTYNLGLSYMNNGELDASIETFQYILNSGVDDDEYIGGSIMSNPFANYKHKSSILLSTIFEEMEKYDSAIVYLSYSDTLYPLKSSCGNEYLERAEQRAQDYSRIYQKMGQPEDAISSFLSHVWSLNYENEAFVDSLKVLLIDEKSVLKKFDKALSKMTIDDSKGYCWCTISFMETNMRIPSMYTSDSECNRKKIVRSARKSKLYKMLESL